MGKAKKQAFDAIIRWCEMNRIKLIDKPRHVYPRAYVVGYSAPMCIVVSQPWIDAEKKLADWTRNYPLTSIYKFDKSLRPGDWCHCGFIVTEGVMEHVAIPIEVQK